MGAGQSPYALLPGRKRSPFVTVQVYYILLLWSTPKGPQPCKAAKLLSAQILRSWGPQWLGLKPAGAWGVTGLFSFVLMTADLNRYGMTWRPLPMQTLGAAMQVRSYDPTCVTVRSCWPTTCLVYGVPPQQ